MKNQREVWDSIAVPWKSFRINPIPEVVDFLKNKKGKILDLGCGSGRNLIESKEVILYEVDFSKEMVKFAKENAKKKKINAKFFVSPSDNLPFEDDFFDAAIFAAVLHCIPDEKKREKVLKELFRVLKPNSEAWISVWDKNQDKFKNEKKEIFIPWKHDGKEYLRYYYLYDAKEFTDLLKKTGFEIVSINDDGKNIIAVVRKPID